MGINVWEEYLEARGEDGDSMFLQNIGTHLPDYKMVSYTRRPPAKLQ
jgi:hypothetical protein